MEDGKIICNIIWGFKWLRMNNTDIKFDYINLDENIKSQLNYEMLSFKFGNIEAHLLYKNLI